MCAFAGGPVLARLRSRKLCESSVARASSINDYRTAAGNARERITAKLQRQERVDPPTEFRFRVDDPGSRKLFIALLRRYGILPYRYKGQRLTTVMARVPQTFVADTLWPEFSALDGELQALVKHVTDDIIRRAVFSDTSEAGEVDRDGARGKEHNRERSFPST